MYNKSKNLFWLIIVLAIIGSLYLITKPAPTNQPKSIKTHLTTTNQTTPEAPPQNNENKLCIQVISFAINPSTGICEQFPTPCDIPAGWTSCDGIPEEPQTTTTPADNNKTPITANNFKVYYPKDSDNGECSQVYAMTRPISLEYEPMQVNAIMTLLQTPDENMTNDGYYSPISSDTRLIKIWISKGIAQAYFNDKLLTNDICTDQTIKQQIIKTLTQFDDIDTVEIYMNDELIK